MWVYCISFICSSVDAHLGCFYFGAPVNNASVNIHVQFLCEHIFSFLWDIYLEVEWLDHMVSQRLNFWGTPKLFSKAAVTFSGLTGSAWWFHFLQVLITTCPSFGLELSYSSGYEVVVHGGFNLQFPDG